MIQSGLILLPLLALVLIFRFTWFSDESQLLFKPRKVKRRYRAKVLFHRCLIGSLLLSTLIAEVIAQSGALQSVPSLYLGAIICAVMIAPVILYILVEEFRAAPGDGPIAPNSAINNDGVDSNASGPAPLKARVSTDASDISADEKTPDDALATPSHTPTEPKDSTPTTVAQAETTSAPSDRKQAAPTTDQVGIDLGDGQKALADTAISDNSGPAGASMDQLRSEIIALRKLVDKQNNSIEKAQQVHQAMLISLKDANSEISRLKREQADNQAVSEGS